MKNYLKISVVLCAIALICSAILASLNLLTKPIIDDNSAKKQTETIQSIYSEYDSNNSKVTYDTANGSTGKAAEILKVVEAKDASGNILGYVYTVKGSNSYGTIQLMVAISNDNIVHQVEFLENNQSFASTVASWVKQTFNNKGSEKHEAGFTSDSVSGKELTESELTSVDVKCGATYGATTVKTLVNIALTDKEAA